MTQPWLHDLEIAVDGPATVLTERDGRISGGATGWVVDDRRVLRRLQVTLDSRPATPVAAATVGATARFWSVARHLGSVGPDPTVEVHQDLTVRGHELLLGLKVTSRAPEPVSTQVRLDLGPDGTEMSVIKQGDEPATPPLADLTPVVGWSDERHQVQVCATPDPTTSALTADGGVGLTWDVHLEPYGEQHLELMLRATRTGTSAHDADAGSDACDWGGLDVVGDDSWVDLVRTNLTDLRHLLQRDPLHPEDVYAAAGTPWYLTLFGRDAIWAARMMLPFSPVLAEGTLRTLARRQAQTHQRDSAAEPGKVLHEVRRGIYSGGDLELPPVYYGTVDATPLWVVLLHETWQAGLAPGTVRELLPHLRAALAWMDRAVQDSPDGLLRYLDTTGHGLSNQGWKDSGDSMRRADGTIAPAPIALLEAQAYAVQAAHGAAELLTFLEEPGAQGWVDWAADLTTRVRDRFWVGEGDQRYLAMAIDADGVPVDGVGSNMGHALGTGLLNPAEEALVAARVTAPDMLRHFGIGTLSAENPAYNPVGYHTGSVWTHDSAIVLQGLARAGFVAEADRVFDALVRLSHRTGHRFPELVGGESLGDEPVPYPAACRPQAWAAASAAVLLQHARTRTTPDV